MIEDEGRVRTLLQTTAVPPSRLDAGALLADGKRSQRRRRHGVVAGAVLAVVAVAVPAAVVLANRSAPPDRPAPAADIATTLRVEHRRTPLGSTTQCTPTAFEVPKGTDFDRPLLTDPTGRRVVVTTRQHVTAYIWTDGRPSDFNGMNNTVPVAVTTDGVVYGVRVDDEVQRSFTYRDLVYKDLPTPDGFTHAEVVAVNGRGDAVGRTIAVSDQVLRIDREALVVWPVDRPDQPRVIDGAGLSPVGILDDGTVVAARNTPDHGPLRSDALVVIRPDDTRVTIDLTGELAAVSPRVGNSTIRGDYLFTHFANPRWPNLNPVRWNLRTGQVEIFDDLFGMTTGNAAGWISATDRATSDDAPAVLVAPDGTARRLSADQHMTWIGPTGTELIGRIGWDGAPLTWHCA